MTMPEALSGNCHYHPGRAGIGICVECRQVICQECTTQFDGINRCASCLAKMSRSAQTHAERRPWGVGSIVGLIACLGAVFAVVYLIARLVSA